MQLFLEPKELIVPLIKWLAGRRVKWTRRKADKILVKRVGEHSGDPPEWVSVSVEQYESQLLVRFVPQGEPISERLYEVSKRSPDTDETAESFITKHAPPDDAD